MTQASTSTRNDYGIAWFYIGVFDGLYSCK